MIKIDAAINQPDQLTTYLKKKYWKSLLWPWNKESFHWMSVHKKKLGYSIIGLGLMTGIYFEGDTVYQYGEEQITKWSWFENTESPPPVTEKNTKTIIYQTTTEYANVRSQASLDSEISFVTSSTDKLTYLNEQTEDAEGRTWLYVENDQGNTGWISSKIVKISSN